MTENRDRVSSRLPVEDSDTLVGVGWLNKGKDFTRGTVPEVFYRRLEELLRTAWQPFTSPGSHECTLCQFEGANGCANIYVPFKGHIYVAPELILHYMNCHHFQPPQGFIDAVLECRQPHYGLQEETARERWQRATEIDEVRKQTEEGRRLETQGRSSRVRCVTPHPLPRLSRHGRPGHPTAAATAQGGAGRED